MVDRDSERILKEVTEGGREKKRRAETLAQHGASLSRCTIFAIGTYSRRNKLYELV